MLPITAKRMQPRVLSSLWVTTLQFLLVVSWTLYALFLPPLLDAVGMARRWLVWLLALDQAIFAISD